MYMSHLPRWSAGKSPTVNTSWIPLFTGSDRDLAGDMLRCCHTRGFRAGMPLLPSSPQVVGGDPSDWNDEAWIPDVHGNDRDSGMTTLVLSYPKVSER